MPSKWSTGHIAAVGVVRLTLELTTYPTETGGNVLATAILTTERSPVPLESHTVVFYHGATEVATGATGPDGRASYDFTGLGFGAHAISIQTAGLHVTDRTTFTPASGARRIGAPSVRAEGDNGHYVISVSVPTSDGGAAADIPIRLLISPLGARPQRVDLATDGNGFADYELDFTEPECDVTAQILGTEIKITNLQGPARWVKPKPYRRPSDSELMGGGPRGVIRRAWQRGLADRKGGSP